MNQYELDKEYNEFIAKFTKTGKEFVHDFNNLWMPHNFRAIKHSIKNKINITSWNPILCAKTLF